MKRRDLIDKHRYPNKGGYIQGFIESDIESDDYGNVTSYGEQEDFLFAYVDNSDQIKTDDRMKRDIIVLVIETTADLPFKNGDRINLNPNDVISTVDEIKTARRVNSVDYKPSDNYNKLKAKYPNRHQDLRVKVITLM